MKRKFRPNRYKWEPSEEEKSQILGEGNCLSLDKQFIIPFGAHFGGAIIPKKSTWAEQWQYILDNNLCYVCAKRKASELYASDLLAATHGGTQPRCKQCTTRSQLRYCTDCGFRVPKLLVKYLIAVIRDN